MKKSNDAYGIVQFGRVTCYASWLSKDGHVEMAFDTQSLLPKEQAELRSYQQSSLPLPVQLPSDHEPSQGVVVGFIRDGRTVRFYVSRRKPLRKKAPLDDGADGEAKPLVQIPG